MSEMQLATQIVELQRRIKELEGRESPEYSTGSFTPVLAGTGTAGAFTYVANVNVVEWTRHGNRVFFNGRLQISAIGTPPTGSMTITGWPFPGVADSSMAIAGGADVFSWTANIAAGYTHVGGQFANGSSAMTLTENGDNVALAAIQGGEIVATSQFRFEGSYRVA